MSRRNVFLIALNISLMGAFSLLAVRMFVARTDGYFFLLWNLFLAAIPYWIAAFFERSLGKNTHMTNGLWIVFLVWLFFFPNAPYIVTDFVHLPWEYEYSQSFAYDFVLVATFAFSGMLFGMGALFRVHRALRKAIGRWWGDAAMVAVIFLSGIGIYLGRFLRWNSWDAFLNPLLVFRDTLSHYGDPVWFARAVALSFLFSIGIGASYLFFVAAYWALGWRRNRSN
ncbi:MAG: DUF1361 domain-containing protein [Candidatus Moraniibacteriota bacterium]|nr:MAG: DUF1361 domain-containing protein [Candidatus Moranbacteria bacterium]